MITLQEGSHLHVIFSPSNPDVSKSGYKGSIKIAQLVPIFNHQSQVKGLDQSGTPEYHFTTHPPTHNTELLKGF